MPRKIKDVKEGVAVKINATNSKKIVKITDKTHRTFATEVNLAVEEYDPKIHKYRDDGK